MSNPVNCELKTRQLAAPGSELVVVPDATHEALTYYFEDLTGPILNWLDMKN